jgi:hypothetical protein
MLDRWFERALAVKRVEHLWDEGMFPEAAMLEHRYQSDFAKWYFAGEKAGIALGRAEAILRVLAARHIDVSPTIAERVRDCEEIEKLDEWLERALVVTRARELFRSGSRSGSRSRSGERG